MGTRGTKLALKLVKGEEPRQGIPQGLSQMAKKCDFSNTAEHLHGGARGATASPGGKGGSTKLTLCKKLISLREMTEKVIFEKVIF